MSGTSFVFVMSGIPSLLVPAPHASDGSRCDARCRCRGKDRDSRCKRRIAGNADVGDDQHHPDHGELSRKAHGNECDRGGEVLPCRLVGGRRRLLCSADHRLDLDTQP
jgi:hypothetical protein